MTNHTPNTTDSSAHLVASSLEARDEYQRARATALELAEALRADLTPAQWERVRRYSDARSDQEGAFGAILGAGPSRHLPHLAPSLALVHAHVLTATLDQVGQCCVEPD